VAAVAFCRPDAEDVIVRGQMRGAVIRELRGTGGFGYDVLFQAEGYDRTTAELTIEEKDAISHRGKALREIAPIVAKALEA
jgi:XTP/dITP diphosphohydrolase